MTATPAIDGWFTTGPEPALLGSRCTTCGTVFFPRTSGFCRNPACGGEDVEETALSRRGTAAIVKPGTSAVGKSFKLCTARSI